MTAEAWLAVLHRTRSAEARRDLLAEAGSADALGRFAAGQLELPGLGAQAVAELSGAAREEIKGWRAWLDEPGHHLVSLGSPRYPRRLAQIPEPPLALWVVGDRLELLGAPQLAIVGSRNASHGGRATAERFGRYLSERGLTITSGLAMGIDAAGHEGALRGPGSTVAVFGCGIDVIFPRNHAALAEHIAAAGLLVSEHGPGVPPAAHRFPQRNRIIAGLSLGTLVVEAGRRSGALITARRAGEYGRDTFAIPGSIHNPLARGCHWLIRQGAKLVEEGADILVELAPQLEHEDLIEPPRREPGEPEEPSAIGRDPAYAKLLNHLGFEPATVAGLAARSGLTTAELSSMLLLLELEGLVEALPGGRYCRLK